jgi:hypothetical protein
MIETPGFELRVSNFEFVSDFALRISGFHLLDPSHDPGIQMGRARK